MSCKFNEKFYDWDYDNDDTDYVFNYVHDPNHSANNFVYIEFSYKQLGETEAWLDNQIRAMQGDMALVKRELLLQWTLASNTSPFDEEQLSNIEQYIIKEPYGTIELLNNEYSITILRHPKNIRNKNYVIGVDVSGGLGNDASAITVIDPKDQSIVMVFKNNFISVTKLSELLIELVTTYIPNAVVIPERNSMGIALINLLDESVISDNLYYRTKVSNGVEKISQELPSMFIKGKKKGKGQLTIVKGADTTTKVREYMINEILFMIVNERPELVNNDSLLDELKTLERKKNGKIEHAAGKHDDQLFSYLIGLYPLLRDNNIGHFVKDVSDGDNEKTPEEKRETNRNINNLKQFNDAIVKGHTSSSIANILTDNHINKTYYESKKDDESYSTNQRLKRYRDLINK